MNYIIRTIYIEENNIKNLFNKDISNLIIILKMVKIFKNNKNL
jgi:hypothetical protein